MKDVIAEDIDRIRSKVDCGFFEGKRILVSGGAGFIGSYLCESILCEKTRIVCVDDFSTGVMDNLRNLEGKRNFQLVKSDVLNFKAEGKFDLIFHLASRASPEEYQQHPVETLTVNSLGSLKLLEVARKSDAPILFASTSEVYGDAELVPTPESYWGNVNPTGVRSCYDEGKRFGEALFMAYQRQYGLDVRIARIHNTYGPRLRADGVYARALSRFILQALENRDLTVYGDGSQTRSFCYISDTARGLIKAATVEKAKGQVINIGSVIETQITELAEKIIGLIHSRSEVVFKPLPEDDPKRRCPDITKARAILDWTPEIELETGLKRSIEWYKTPARM